MRGYTCWDFHAEKRVVGSTSGSQRNMDDDLPINNDRRDLNDMLDDMDDDVAQKEHAKFEKLFVVAEKALFGSCTKLTILSALKGTHTAWLQPQSSLPGYDDPLNYVNAAEAGTNFSLDVFVGSTSGSERNMDDDLPINNDRRDLNDMLDDMDDDVAQKEHAKFEKLFVAAEKALFGGCTKLTILSAVIKLLKIKASFGWSDISFTTLIEFLHQGMLPDDNQLPISTYQAKKLMCPMDLEIERIDACPNDCPKQPGNDIDVYLKPLIDDLVKLWEPGVKVYDAYSKNHFMLRAMIFCTISDFPAYDNLSGYSTKGKKACRVCEDCTHSVWLRHCRKTIYMGHRRSLLRNHPYRKKKELFDGTIERGVLRPPLDGEATFSRVRDMNIVLGKGKDNLGPPKGIWKKKSIFWVLPYWEHLQVRHCLDVMYIKKNVCESFPGKTKDGVNVRNDMEDMGIRPELAAKVIPGKRGMYLPPAFYTMSKIEKTKFCQCLHGIKVPSGYSANIKKLVSMKDLKLSGMKSHDCHVLMTQMTPIAIRAIPPNQVRHTITKLCLFFNMIHSKVIDPEVLDKWQHDVILTLCQLEMYFPPSFFDVMVHLVSHIVREIKMTGPPFLRSMYPFERYMGYLKGYAQKDAAQEAKEVLENRLIDVGYNIGARGPLLNAAYLRWMSRDDSTSGYVVDVPAGTFVGQEESFSITVDASDILEMWTNGLLDASIITYFNWYKCF
ncbi:uncharacterized protein Tco_0393734 [Tanacetum coccineum]